MGWTALVEVPVEFWLGLSALGVAIPLLGYSWFRRGLGPRRAALAATCRALWVFPLLAALSPQVIRHELPDTLALRRIHVLVDDSQSMTGAKAVVAQAFVDRLAGLCLRYDCRVDAVPLSRLDPLVAQGWTPLSDVLPGWLIQVGDDPWVLVSDGGDWRADATLALPRTTPGRGLVVGVQAEGIENLWIARAQAPPMLFAGRGERVRAWVGRQGDLGRSNLSQVQALLDGKVLATATIAFEAGERELEVDLAVPPLTTAASRIEVRVLPVPGEIATWDNSVHLAVQVHSNTLGLLHLLGSPSWDGRFLRRFFKSEPKFDLVSFFILRDPWDSQIAQEREMSLIPFPVERLFQEELPNFRAVVMQNFSLSQFLQPEIQERLVQYVQNGGSLLYLGGPRAFHDSDLQGSPLSAILPVDPKAFLSPSAGTTQRTQQRHARGIRSFSAQPQNETSPSYDASNAFKLAASQPTVEQRQLAAVYDEWARDLTDLGEGVRLRGIHRLKKQDLRAGLTTPLLDAVYEDGSRAPLAVASYPGKGRAIWIFSDSLWQLAMQDAKDASRQLYNRIMTSAMAWLTEPAPILFVKNVEILLPATLGPAPRWRITVQGPGVQGLQGHHDDVFDLKVCDESIRREDVTLGSAGAEQVVLSGDLPRTPPEGYVCTAEIQLSSPRLGLARAKGSGVARRPLPDREVPGSIALLQRLVSDVQGTYLDPTAKGGDLLQSSDGIERWLQSATGSMGVGAATRVETETDYYWAFRLPWAALFFFFMIAEVVVRRWSRASSATAR